MDQVPFFLLIPYPTCGWNITTVLIQVYTLFLLSNHAIPRQLSTRPKGSIHTFIGNIDLSAPSQKFLIIDSRPYGRPDLAALYPGMVRPSLSIFYIILFEFILVF